MQKKNVHNQVNKPGKGDKSEAVWKIYFKHDGCSMLFLDKLTYVSALCKVKLLKRNNWNYCGKFIITK